MLPQLAGCDTWHTHWALIWLLYSLVPNFLKWEGGNPSVPPPIKDNVKTTTAKFQFWSGNKIMSWLGVPRAWGRSPRKVENHCSIWKLCLQKQHVLRTESPVGAERRTQDSHGNMTSSLPGYSGSVTRWWVISHPLPLSAVTFPPHSEQICRWASVYKSQYVVLCAQGQRCLSSHLLCGPGRRNPSRSSLFRVRNVWTLCSKSVLKPKSF